MIAIYIYICIGHLNVEELLKILSVEYV